MHWGDDDLAGCDFVDHIWVECLSHDVSMD